jgi:hypothetical protein
MSKSLSNSNLSGRPAIRPLLAVFLCTSMAAFGCTTDRNLGNGDPVGTPGVRSVPTGGTSAGSESEPVPPPMMSSSSAGTVQPRIARLSADQAAAIMAQQQRVRVLGPASPDNGGRPYVSDRMMVSSQQYGAQSSVNSTLYSGPTAAITSGAGEAVVTGDIVDTGVAVGDNGAAVIAGSSVGATVTGTTTTLTNAAGPVIAPTGTTITPTSSAVATPSAFASVRTLSPTAAAVVNPPASVSGSPAIAATSSTRTAGTTTTINRTATTNSATSVSNSNATTNAGVANPVRVLNTNGRVTITNSGTTRQQ